MTQAAGGIGGIPLRGGGMRHARHCQASPVPRRHVRGLRGYRDRKTHGRERLDYTQRAMVNPMVQEATRDLITIEDAAMARYAADSPSAALGPEQRATASTKLSYYRNRHSAFLKASETPEDFTTVAAQEPGASELPDPRRPRRYGAARWHATSEPRWTPRNKVHFEFGLNQRDDAKPAFSSM